MKHEAVQNLPALHRLDANLGQQSSSEQQLEQFYTQSSSATVAIVVTLASSG